MRRESTRRITQLFSIAVTLCIIALTVVSMTPILGLVDEAGYARVVEIDNANAGVSAVNNPAAWRYGDCYVTFFLHNSVVAWSGSLDFETWTTVEEVSLITTTGDHWSSAMNRTGFVAYVVTENGADSNFYYRYGQVNSTCGIGWAVAEQTQATTYAYNAGQAAYPSIDIDDDGDMWIGLMTKTTTPYHTEIWECRATTCTLRRDITGTSTQAMYTKVRAFTPGVAILGLDASGPTWSISYTDDGGTTWSAWVPLTSQPTSAAWERLDVIVHMDIWYHVLRGSSGNNIVGVWPWASGWSPAEVDLGHAYLGDHSITFIYNDLVVGFGGFGFQWSEDYGTTWSDVFELPGVGGSDMPVGCFMRAPRGLTNDRGVNLKNDSDDMMAGLFKHTVYYGADVTVTEGGVNQVYVGGTTANETGFELDDNLTYFYLGVIPFDGNVVWVEATIKNVTNPTYTHVPVYLIVYLESYVEPEYAEGGCIITGLYPMRRADIRQFVLENETENEIIGFNPNTAFARNQCVAIALATPYEGVFAYVSPLSPVMYETTGNFPETFYTYSESSPSLNFWGILQYKEDTQYVTTTVAGTCTVTSTATMTSIVDPDSSAAFLPNLIIFGLLFLLPPLLFAYYIGGSGITLGLALSLGIGMLMGIVPFWMIVLVALMLVTTIVLRLRGIGNRGD